MMLLLLMFFIIGAIAVFFVVERLKYKRAHKGFVIVNTRFNIRKKIR